MDGTDAVARAGLAGGRGRRWGRLECRAPQGMNDGCRMAPGAAACGPAALAGVCQLQAGIAARTSLYADPAEGPTALDASAFDPRSQNCEPSSRVFAKL